MYSSNIDYWDSQKCTSIKWELLFTNLTVCNFLWSSVVFTLKPGLYVHMTPAQLTTIVWLTWNLMSENILWNFLGQPFGTWSPWVYGCPNLLKFLRISIKDIVMIHIVNETIMNSIQYFLNFDNLLLHWAIASFLASSFDICTLIDLLTYCDCDVFSERVNLHHLLTQLCCHSMDR